jgi:hypothetical protein
MRVSRSWRRYASTSACASPRSPTADRWCDRATDRRDADPVTRGEECDVADRDGVLRGRGGPRRDALGLGGDGHVEHEVARVEWRGHVGRQAQRDRPGMRAQHVCDGVEAAAILERDAVEVDHARHVAGEVGLAQRRRDRGAERVGVRREHRRVDDRELAVCFASERGAQRAQAGAVAAAHREPGGRRGGSGQPGDRRARDRAR